MTLRSTTAPPVRLKTRIGQADRGAEVATRVAAAPMAMPSSALTRLPPAVSAASPRRSMPTR
eukprot:11083819-Alexandrium_andersonii.AAC.1